MDINRVQKYLKWADTEEFTMCKGNETKRVIGIEKAVDLNTEGWWFKNYTQDFGNLALFTYRAVLALTQELGASKKQQVTQPINIEETHWNRKTY